MLVSPELVATSLDIMRGCCDAINPDHMYRGVDKDGRHIADCARGMSHGVDDARGRIRGEGVTAFFCSSQNVLTEERAGAGGSWPYDRDNRYIRPSKRFPVHTFPGEDRDDLLGGQRGD